MNCRFFLSIVCYIHANDISKLSYVFISSVLHGFTANSINYAYSYNLHMWGRKTCTPVLNNQSHIDHVQCFTIQLLLTKYQIEVCKISKS